MRSVLPLLLVLSITITGCGDSGSSGSDSDTSKADATTAPGELSEHDAKVVANVDEDVNDWNKAATDWSKAYKAGDSAAFLKVYDGYTETLHKSSIRIRLASSQFEDPKLKGMMRDLGDAYRAQFRAIVKVNDSVVNGDLKAGQRAVARLQRAGERKLRIAEKLVDEYPVLGADLAG